MRPSPDISRRLTMAELEQLPVGTPIRVKWAVRHPWQWFDRKIGRFDGLTCSVNDLGDGTEIQERDFVVLDEERAS